MTVKMDSYLHDKMVCAVKKAIKDQGITQAELSHRAGYSERHVSCLLCGKVQGRLQSWEDLAKALGLTWSVTLD